MEAAAHKVLVANVKKVAALLRTAKDLPVIFLTGAGVSVNAGIPDFRSPGGMYATLRPELLTATKDQKEMMKIDPTAVVSWDMFQYNPLPYLEVRRPFILGTAENKWKMTLAHVFPVFLERRGLLRRVYTQNIDGLDFQAVPLGLPQEKIISVHGTIAIARCEFCGTECAKEEFLGKMRSQVKDIYNIDETAPNESTPIKCEACGKPGVKPDTVLYGRSLPDSFASALSEDRHDAGLCIVMGTSLTVYPAASIPHAVPYTCCRVIIDRNDLDVAGFGNPKRDTWLGGDSDDVLLRLLVELGWHDEAIAMAKQGVLCEKTTKAILDTTQGLVAEKAARDGKVPAAAAAVGTAASETGGAVSAEGNEKAKDATSSAGSNEAAEDDGGGAADDARGFTDTLD